jgi:anti-sigma B factor antagonist
MGSAAFSREEIDAETTVLAVAGELDYSNAAELRRRIDEVLTRRSGTLVVDLGDLIHLDSSGLAELIAAHQRAKANSIRFVLAISSPGLRRTIEIRGLDGIFTIVETRADALAQPNGTV